MTEREKLIELLTDTLHDWECDAQPETVSQIAEHLLDNGVVVLPAKVGDTIFTPWCDDDGEFQIDENEILDVSAQKVWICGGGFSWESIGVTDFLTREEAEKALADRKAGELNGQRNHYAGCKMLCR